MESLGELIGQAEAYRLPATDMGNTPEDSAEALREAASEGDLPALKALIATGVDVNSVDDNDDTALHYACRANMLASVKALLAAGANVNAKNESATTPLSLAHEYQSAAVVEWMESEGFTDTIIR